MRYFANFQSVDGALMRFDTRVYLSGDPSSVQQQCVGCVVGKNPGSAIPRVQGALEELELDGDKMLLSVGNRFVAAYQVSGKPMPLGAYVQIWNLLYICNKNVREAARTAFSPRPCTTESHDPPFVWFAWGGSHNKLNAFKGRFLNRHYKRAFFYSPDSQAVVERAPAPTEMAKHTQGMPGSPAIAHLAKLL